MKTITLFLSLVVALTLATTARAVILISNGIPVPLNGTTVVARPELAGTVIANVMRPFSIDMGNGFFTTGQIQDWVVREDVSHTLDFYYRIFNDANSAGLVTAAMRNHFTGFSTDADWLIDGDGTVSPTQGARSLNSDQVAFGFTNQIAPGQQSLFFFVKTDAVDYNAFGVGTLLAEMPAVPDPEVFFLTFQPVTVASVPEPGTFAMMGLGLAGLLLCGWRRHRSL